MNDEDRVLVLDKEEEDIDDRKGPRLENWVCYQVSSHKWLEGNIYDDPRFKDGSWVHTSRVVHLTDYSAETRNTFYILGRKG